MMQKRESGFCLFGKWIVETWREGRGCSNLWNYLFVGMIGCGGVGFWLLPLNAHVESPRSELLMAFCSFAPAITGASCMDYIFGENERKYLYGFAFLFGAIVLVLTVIAFAFVSYLCAAAATFLSLVIWWFANAGNPKLADIAGPLSPIGGDSGADVGGTIGDIKI